MTLCKKCLFPDTKPDLKFVDGICSACLYAEKKKTINWTKRGIELRKICVQYSNGNSWDCIIAVSGGKDSHYITYYMKEVMGMNPLLVCFVPSDQTPLGRKNLDNIKKEFDVDCIEFFAKPSDYKHLQNIGLLELGDHAYPEHLGIFSIPFLIAKNFGIKLVVWAEDSHTEYGGLPKKDDQFVDGLFKDKIKPKNPDPVYHTLKDPDIKSIYLGDYINWDAGRQTKMMDKRGFTRNDGPMEWAYKDYENLDTKYVALHDYFKYLKFGYGRAADQAGIDIRHGRMTRQEGQKMVEKYDNGKIPNKYLQEFLDEFNLSYEEFVGICDKFNYRLFK